MIHPTAIVDPKAELHESVEVGPYSVIGPKVTIGANTRIGPHVVIEGRTTIGEDNHIFQFSSIGAIPQDKKYAGEDTQLIIGNRNVIRESCTFNLGTEQGGGVTKVGNDNWIMAYVHLAHDCIIGNNTIFANNASLAGHVTIEDHAILGGFSIVHQFCRVGSYSLLAMGAGINKDVPPFVIVSGHLATPHGLNIEGMRRHKFSKTAIEAVRKSYKIIYRSGLKTEEAVEQLRELAKEESAINLFIDFFDKAQRGIAR